jgi:hypothetical protein
MSVGLFALAYASTGEPIDAWLQSFDVDAADGRGVVTFTRDAAKARRFFDAIDAATTWKMTSTVRPVREDGRPNRPLTAFTCETRPLP